MSKDSYITISIHFIDSDWNLGYRSLGAVPFPGEHTSLRVAEITENLLNEFHMPEGQKPSATSDQGSNVRRALETLMQLDWIPCVAHITNLAVRGTLDTLPDHIQALVENCNEVASVFRVSPKQKHIFREI